MWLLRRLMASPKKIIAVVGATGNQGSGLVNAILKEGPKSEFVVRAITRDVSSQKALALKQKGAEIAQADVTNEAALTEAIKGCYGFYCVTTLDFANPEGEKEQAKCLAAAAKNAGIKHIVWSTLEDSRKLVPLESTSMPTLHGRFKVPHFDIKAEADEYFAKLPTTYMVTSFYMENFTTFFKPQKGQDGKYTLGLPMGKRRLPMIATDDIGKCAFGIFKRPDYIGKRLGIAGEMLTMAEVTAKMSKALGKDVAYAEVPFEAFRKFNADIGNMFQYYHDCEKEFCAARSLEESRKLNPELLTFDQWLAKNKDRIPLE